MSQSVNQLLSQKIQTWNEIQDLEHEYQTLRRDIRRLAKKKKQVLDNITRALDHGDRLSRQMVLVASGRLK